MKLVNVVKKYLPLKMKTVLKSVFRRDAFISYSQFGEDAYLNSYFRGKTWQPGCLLRLPNKGFYVDIGAYSPTECSNTHAFYQHGWRGINIDPTPGVIESFGYVRRRDINLALAIGSETKDIPFYSWGSPNVFNTADSQLARERTITLGEKPAELIIKCIPLKEMFDRYLPNNMSIDFLTVDVEGLDLEVLQSNDWKKYRPELIVAEVYCNSFEEILNEDLPRFMIQNDYEIIAWLKPSIIFRDTKNK